MKIHQIQKRKSMWWHKPSWYLDGETLSSVGMNATGSGLILNRTSQKCRSFELTCVTQVEKQQRTSSWRKTVPWWPGGHCLPPAGPYSVRPGPPRPCWGTCGSWIDLNVRTCEWLQELLEQPDGAIRFACRENGGVSSTRFIKSLGSSRVGWGRKFDDAEADDWTQSHLR